MVTFGPGVSPFKVNRSTVKIFDSKYLENGDRYEVGPPGALTCRTHTLSIGTVRFDLE